MIALTAQLVVLWVIVVGFEAVAGAGILQKWLPDIPLWIMSLHPHHDTTA